MRKEVTKYDDVKWHVGGDFPSDLSPNEARTHMGMFIAWAAERGLLSEMVKTVHPNEVDLLITKKMKGSEFIRLCCDDKLSMDDFSDVGNAFVKKYYEKIYMEDYAELSSDDLPTIYHEPDTVEKYEQVKKLLDAKFENSN